MIPIDPGDGTLTGAGFLAIATLLWERTRQLKQDHKDVRKDIRELRDGQTEMLRMIEPITRRSDHPADERRRK